MDNWDYFEQNLALAQNSDGALEEQAKIYQESWRAAADEARASLEDVFDSIIDPDFFKTFLQAGSGVLDVLANIVDSLNGLPGILAIVAASFTKIFGSQLTNSINDFSLRFKSVRDNAEQFRTSVSEEERRIRGGISGGTIYSEAQSVVFEAENETKKIIEDKEKYLTPEQRESANNLLEIQKIRGDDLIEKADALDEAEQAKRDAEAKFKNKYGQDKDTLMKTSEDLEARTGVLQGHLKDKNRSQHDRAKLIKDAVFDESSNEGQSAGILEIMKNSDSFTDKDVEDLKGQVDEFFQLSKLKEVDPKEYKELEREILQSIKNARDKALKDIDHVKDEDLNNVERANQEFNKAQTEYSETNENYKQATKEYKKYLENLGTQSQELVNNIGQTTTKTLQGISMLSVGLASLKGGWDALNNTELSFGEKVFQVTQSASIGLMSLLDGINLLKQANIKNTFSSITNFLSNKELVANLVNARMELIDNAAATNKLTLNQKIQLSVLKKLQAANLSLAATLGIVAAALAALAAVAAIVVVAFQNYYKNTPEGKLKQLQENSKVASETLQEVKNSVEQVETALNNLDSGTEILNKLSKNTAEWAKAFAQVNESINQLLLAYPELQEMGYVTVGKDGQLGLSAEGRQYVEEQNAKRLLVASNNATVANILATDQALDIERRRVTDYDSIFSKNGELAVDLTEKAIAEYGRNFQNSADSFGKFMNTLAEQGFDVEESEVKGYLENYSKFLSDNQGKISSNEVLRQSFGASSTNYIGSQRDYDYLKNIGLEDEVYNDIYNKTFDRISSQTASLIVNKGSSIYEAAHGYANMIGGTLIGSKGNKVQIQMTDGEIKEYSSEDIAMGYANQMATEEYTKKILENIKANVASVVEEASLTDSIDVKSLEQETYVQLDNIILGIQKAVEDIVPNATELAKKERVAEMFESITDIFQETEPGKLAEALGQAFQYINMESDKIQEILSKHQNGELSDSEAKGMILEENALAGIDAATSEFKSAIGEYNLDLSVEELQGMARGIYDAAKEGEDFDKSLTQNAEGLKEMAIAMARAEKGIASLSDKFSEWQRIIKNSSKYSGDYSKAILGLREAVADFLNVEKEALTDEFLTKNLSNIEAAMNGSQEAIDQMYEDLEDQAIFKVAAEIDWSSADIKKDDFITQMQDFFDSEELNIPVGASIDDGDFLEALNSLIAASGMTATQVNETLENMGYSPTIEEVEVESQNEIGATETTIETKQTGTSQFTGTLTDGRGGTSSVSYEFPELRVSQTQTPVEPAKTENKMSVPAFSGKGTPKVTNLTNIRASKPAASNRPSGKGKGGGGGGGKKATKTPAKDTVVTRYKEVNDSLKKIKKELDGINQSQDRLYGTSHATALKKQRDLIEEENALLEKKRQEIKSYMVKDQKELERVAAQYGISFNIVDGYITDYTEKMMRYQNEMDAIIDKAGETITEAEQEAYNKLKEEADAINKAISVLEGTVSELEENEQSLLDNYFKKQDLYFEELEYELNIKVDLNDAAQKKLDSILKGYEDDFYKRVLTVEKLATDQVSIYKEASEVQTKSIKDLHAAYISGQISQNDFIDGIKSATDAIYDNISNLQDLEKTMKFFYGETLDAADDELSVYVGHLEHITELFEYYIDLNAVLGKEKNFDVIQTFLGGKAESIKNRISAQQEWYETLMKQRDQIEKDLAQARARGDQDAIEFYEEQWKSIIQKTDEAQNTLLDLTNSWAETMKELISSNMQQLADELEKAFTGGWGFEQLLNNYDRLNTRQEEFLTKTNQIYETNKLMLTANKALDQTTNKVAKQKLKNFVEETKSLQRNTQLSQYELEIQQAKYELLLAEIALEEAQNAKSTMRLARDNEGNFGYIYTADQDAVDDAQQNYNDADNKLYNLALKGQQDYLNKYMQGMSNMMSELQELNEIGLEDEEEYNRRKSEIMEHYLGEGGVLWNYNKLFNIGVQTDTRATADNWQKSYFEMISNTEEWRDNVTSYYEDIDDSIKEWGEIQEETNRLAQNALSNSSKITKELTNESRNLSKQLTSDLVPSIEKVIDAVQKQTEAFIQQLAVMKELSELDMKSIEQGESYIDAIGNYDPNNDYSQDIRALAAQGIEQNREVLEKAFMQRQIKIDSLIRDLGYSDAKKIFIKTNAELMKEIGFNPNSFASGGFTGSWGPQGKLAVLHEKELVLNKADTKNILDSVAFVKDILALIDNQSLNSRLSTLTSGFAPGKANGLEQNISIYAEFPNATNHSEIEEAFNNLANKAAQYAFRT